MNSIKLPPPLSFFSSRGCSWRRRERVHIIIFHGLLFVLVLMVLAAANTLHFPTPRDRRVVCSPPKIVPIAQLKVTEIRSQLKTLGLSTHGMKYELVERLQSALKQRREGGEGRHEEEGKSTTKITTQSPRSPIIEEENHHFEADTSVTPTALDTESVFYATRGGGEACETARSAASAAAAPPLPLPISGNSEVLNTNRSTSRTATEKDRTVAAAAASDTTAVAGSSIGTNKQIILKNETSTSLPMPPPILRQEIYREPTSTQPIPHSMDSITGSIVQHHEGCVQRITTTRDGDDDNAMLYEETVATANMTRTHNELSHPPGVSNGETLYGTRAKTTSPLSSTQKTSQSKTERRVDGSYYNYCGGGRGGGGAGPAAAAAGPSLFRSSSSKLPPSQLRQGRGVYNSRSSQTRQRTPPRATAIPPSDTLYIANLRRPFTIEELREHLIRAAGYIGDAQEEARILFFWVSRNREHCYVQFDSVEAATSARKSLARTRFPPEMSYDFPRLFVKNIELWEAKEKVTLEQQQQQQSAGNNDLVELQRRAAIATAEATRAFRMISNEERSPPRNTIYSKRRRSLNRRHNYYRDHHRRNAPQTTTSTPSQRFDRNYATSGRDISSSRGWRHTTTAAAASHRRDHHHHHNRHVIADTSRPRKNFRRDADYR